MKLLQIAVIICLCSCSERSADEAAESGGVLQIKDVRLMTAQKEGWVTTFGSRAGVFEGTDSDGSITFLDGNRVVVTEFGYAILEWEGTYSVDRDGLISCELRDYEFDWPKMELRKADGKYLLYRVEVPTPSESSVRTGALGDSVELWPFGLQTLSWPEPEEEIDDESEPSLPLFPPE